MLTPDVELRGFTTQEWVRLGALLRGGGLPAGAGGDGAPPPGAGPAAPAAAERDADADAAAGVVALCREGRLLKLLHTGRGRLPLGQLRPPFLPEALAYEHGTRWAAVIEVGALDDVMERFAAASRSDDDLGRQLRNLATAFAEVEQEGRLALWPRPLPRLSFPAERWSDRAFDVLCPDGSALCLGVFEGGELYTALVAHRRGRGFDRLLGPGVLREELGLLSGDWRRDQRHLARAAEAEAGPLGLGCYAEAATLRRLLRTPQPGAWAAAVAAREVVLSPVTPGIALPLGLDLGWAALSGLRTLADRLGAGPWWTADGPFSPWLERLRELLVNGVPADGRDGRGLHPLGLLRQLLLGER